jgi:hypothetical protein
MSASPSSAAQRLCEAAIRGEAPAWPERLDIDGFLLMAELHGVPVLLHPIARRLGWPQEVVERLKARHLQAARWELAHVALVRRALDALRRAGIEPIVLKGTALAHSIYPDGAARLRGDTDLLVPPAAKQAASRALANEGFFRRTGIDGEFISYQATFHDASGRHAIDVHWRFNNSELLASLFTHDELLAGSIGLPALHENARAPSHPASLLLAALHRAVHITNPYWVGDTPIHGTDRLLWLVDLDLLARSLSEPEWELLLGSARSKGLSRVLAQALQDAAARLGTPVPASVSQRLPIAEASAGEPAWQYVYASKRRQRMLDFMALPGWRARLRFTREALLPAREYMRERYGPSSPLAWLYLARLARAWRRDRPASIPR